MAIDRTAAINVRATPEERRQVEELAERDGISASDVVRMLIRRAHRETFGAPAAKAAKKKTTRRSKQ